MLYREPKLLKHFDGGVTDTLALVSVLYREPKLLKPAAYCGFCLDTAVVSVLYREPKLLKPR